jgi:hypothetical protein
LLGGSVLEDGGGTGRFQLIKVMLNTLWISARPNRFFPDDFFISLQLQISTRLSNKKPLVEGHRKSAF